MQQGVVSKRTDAAWKITLPSGEVAELSARFRARQPEFSLGSGFWLPMPSEEFVYNGWGWVKPTPKCGRGERAIEIAVYPERVDRGLLVTSTELAGRMLLTAADPAGTITIVARDGRFTHDATGKIAVQSVPRRAKARSRQLN